MLAVRLIGYVAFETGGYRAGALGGSAGQIERNADGTLEDLFGHYPSAKIGLDTGAGSEVGEPILRCSPS